MDGLPTLTKLLESLSFLGDVPTALGVVLTALLLIILRDWRWSLITLTIQYLLCGWFLTQVFEPDIAPAIAAIKVMSWMIICLVLYLSARQVSWGSLKERNQISTGSDRSSPQNFKVGRWVLPTDALFRLLIGSMTTIAIVFSLNRGDLALPGLLPHINLATVSLMAMGLLALGLTEEPLTAGMGLLTAMSGFGLYYHSLEQGITVVTFLIAVDFMIVAVSAYLTIAHHWTRQDAERRSPT
jgi:predicted secreted protein